MHNPESVLENETHKLLWGFEIQSDHPISVKMTRPYDYKQKKRTCRIVDFAVPVDNRVKLKESEKNDEYLGLARPLKKLWNMKVTIILIVIKGIDDLEIRGRVETIQITASVRSARILRRVIMT